MLLIEDDEELQDNLYQTLSIFFKKVILAKNGMEGIEKLKSHKIDMIISDYVMPIMDGEEFCRYLRKNNYNIPVTIISNYYEKEKLIKLIDLELTNYLLKPISYNELIDCLKNMLKRIDKLSLNDFQINYDINYNFLTKELINNKKNTQYKLSKSEIILLELLLNNPNSIISIETIQSHLSPNEIKSEQAIKNIIHRLRLKIGKDNIQNIQSLGYSFRKEI
ncbi:response regulator transcription factor [Arcobacter suis]|nr:response regulator [Arcobacter suis]